jgi:hypothetical protein
VIVGALEGILGAILYDRIGGEAVGRAAENTARLRESSESGSEASDPGADHELPADDVEARIQASIARSRKPPTG